MNILISLRFASNTALAVCSFNNILDIFYVPINGWAYRKRILLTNLTYTTWLVNIFTAEQVHIGTPRYFQLV